MYYVYILQDQSSKLSIGYSTNLRRRIQEHLAGKVFTTKRMTNPRLIYYEAYEQELTAKTREKRLKQFGSSYQGLLKRIAIK